MSRVKRGTTTHARHRKVIKRAKGYRGRRSTNFRSAVQAVERGMQYAYRDRRVRKRSFRSLWIQRINAAARSQGLTYAQLIDGLHKAGIAVDRKNLAELAYENSPAFTSLVEEARTALEKSRKETSPQKPAEKDA